MKGREEVVGEEDEEKEEVAWVRPTFCCSAFLALALPLYSHLTTSHFTRAFRSGWRREKVVEEEGGREGEGGSYSIHAYNSF